MGRITYLDAVAGHGERVWREDQHKKGHANGYGLITMQIFVKDIGY